MATNSTSVRAFTALKNLPPFPPVASKVIILLNRQLVSFRDVADTLKTDAALCAEVLRLANSALAGQRNHVNTILEALALVGTDRVAGLLMTLSISKMLKRAGCSKTIRRAWRHSLACALAAREFASTFGVEADHAYQAGLFHDVGRLALLVLQPALYDNLISQPGDLRALEKEHFGLDHCEAGQWLLEHWKLPAMFVEVAQHHHSVNLDLSRLTLVVKASCAVADQLGFSVRPTAAVPDIAEKLAFMIADTINSLECEYGI